MAHHLALTVAFEASVRAVNPAVTIPYWDFTIEGETISQAGGELRRAEVRSRNRIGCSHRSHDLFFRHPHLK